MFEPTDSASEKIRFIYQLLVHGELKGIKGAWLDFLKPAQPTPPPRMLPAVDPEAHRPSLHLLFRPRLAAAASARKRTFVFLERRKHINPRTWTYVFCAAGIRRFWRLAVRFLSSDGEATQPRTG